jgi:hypothetical protein
VPYIYTVTSVNRARRKDFFCLLRKWIPVERRTLVARLSRKSGASPMILLTTTAAFWQQTTTLHEQASSLDVCVCARVHSREYIREC